MAGYYRVKVSDAHHGMGDAQITLTEPDEMRPDLVPYVYSGGYNISCFNCYNGSIDLTMEGGVGPFSYLWNNGATTEDRSGLGSENHSVVVTDANGCPAYSDVIFLTQPERNDWTMSGNAGTNPPTQYIGTSDNKDLVFKTNGTDRLRLLSNGEVRAGSLAASGYCLLVADQDGTLKRLGGGGGPLYGAGCPAGDRLPWTLCGNVVSSGQFLGSLNAEDLVFMTNSDERMRITQDGGVEVDQTMEIGGFSANYSPGLGIGPGANGDWLALQRDLDEGSWRFHESGANELSIRFRSEAGAISPGLTLWQDGKVSVGPCDVSTDYRLFVTGGLQVDKLSIATTNNPGSYGLYVGNDGILATKVKVALTTTTEWSDHVFHHGYSLMPLTEVQRFINENGHLPGVPSAAEMVKNGLDVVQTDAMLLEKIEEMTLHLIDLNGRLLIVERENKLLKAKVSH